MNNRIMDICKNKSILRSKIKNSKNGHAYMESFITNKKQSCFLWDWYK